MAVIRVQASLTRASLLPEDVITNTWHFTTQDNVDPGRAAQTVLATLALEQFYVAIQGELSNALAGPVELKAYDLSEPEPRVPFVTTAFAITTGAQSLPGETAITMSFQGDQISGVSQARRRGRAYLGPVTTLSMEEVPGGQRPRAITRQTIANAGQALMDASDAAADWSWIVFSPTSAGPELVDGTFTNLAAGVVVITNGWVDNAYDTIRSRGVEQTSRIVWS